MISSAPATGIYTLADDGVLTFRRPAQDWHTLDEPHEAFFLRVYGAGDYLFKGADLGILVTKNRMQTDDKRLTPKGLLFIDGITGMFVASPVDDLAPPPHHLLAYLK